MFNLRRRVLHPARPKAIKVTNDLGVLEAGRSKIWFFHLLWSLLPQKQLKKHYLLAA